ncbi:hypothetical protein VNO77_05031 [Canavalia gladiata]|uniref:Uncharacterized protein n=1 Tax=Canavalia gladiata TaxID=3824 RepID=A0AAN9MZM3_CANGL
MSGPNLIEIYNPSLNTWSHVGAIPGLIDGLVLKGFAMVSLGDSIFIIGGQVCYKERFHDMMNHLNWFMWASNQWFNCAPLGVAVYDFACTVWDKGKSTLASARGISYVKKVKDLDLDTWTPLPNLPILGHQMGMLRHLMASFGMKLMDDINQVFPHWLDTNNEHWPPNQRLYLTMVPIGTQLFFLGGYGVSDVQLE